MATDVVINGFRADTELLISRFVNQNATSFDAFCFEWNRMNFQYVFCGYMCLSELAQFLEDAFIVLKRALLNATSHFEKIGALYLMYSMYFKQPPKQYCKFRMTMDEWIKINQFYNEVCIFHSQAGLIFWKLLQNDAFRFVEAEYEYGFERFMQKGMTNANDDSKFRKITPMIDKTIASLKDQTTGIISALDILQVGYNEMKEHIDQSASILPATTIATEILKDLGKIEKLFNVQTTVNEADASDASDKPEKSLVNTKRKTIKKKAFSGESGSSSTPKEISMKYRTYTTDDGNFINIAKSSQNKYKKINALNERQIKTVVKQLEVPMQNEDELEVSPSTSSKTEKKKQSMKDKKGKSGEMKRVDYLI